MELAKNVQKVYCGIDFHKSTSTLCTLDDKGKAIEPITTIDTKKLVQYLSNKKNYKIGIEATGGVNHVVEQLKAGGHEVVIINPNQFRGIGIGGKKTDTRDAKALAEALRLGFIPEVHHRSLRSREIKSLLTTREHLVQARVDSINHVRGTLREYGITMPQGAEVFYTQATERINQIKNIYIKNNLLSIFELITGYKSQEKQIEEQLIEFTKNDPMREKLESVPGVGLMTSLMMLAVVDDVKRFKNAKVFASYLGLTPSESSSGNKKHMGPITRSGSEMLRRYLIHGARAWMRYSSQGDPNREWAEKLSEKNKNKAIVALAHRMSRICFAIMRDQSIYDKKHKKQKTNEDHEKLKSA
jgi:transposase